MLQGPGFSQAPPGKGPPYNSYPGLLNSKVSLASLRSVSEDVRVQANGSGDASGWKHDEPRALLASTSAWTSTKPRPLSDICELTEPSVADSGPRKLHQENVIPRKSSVSRKPSVASRTRPSVDSQRSRGRDFERRDTSGQRDNGIGSGRKEGIGIPPSTPSPADNTYSSIFSIPRDSVPPRSSSKVRNNSASRPKPPPSMMAPESLAQRTPIAPKIPPLPPLPPPPPPPNNGRTITLRGKSRSPLRQVAARDAVSHDTQRRIPSRTFIREPYSSELPEFPIYRHPRVHLGLDLHAGIFVGGSTIEGTVQINVDDSDRVRYKKTVDIARISIDLLGLEEMTGSKRSVFLNLATELIDRDNPPPHNMVTSQEQLRADDPFWHLAPSITHLPFIMSLPLNVGPPPFHSKHARIRYLLCVSLLIRDQGKHYIVRTSEEVSVLSVYDPEKALMSLPSPLTASDEYVKLHNTRLELVRLTAGLHRQVWVSGSTIYVDVHILNNSRKTIKRIELQLERDILCYKHAAAATMEKSASQARIFDTNDRSILSKASVKPGTAGWHGVPPHSTHMRTCDVEVPRGHATVKCGKYFEVRYFLNVIASTFRTKLIAVQLPIVLIHMNSLDVVPNSVAQVAAAIEEKRTAQSFPRVHTPPRVGRRPSVQGLAFAAPRTQSLNRMRAEAADIEELGRILERSPRKHTRHPSAQSVNYNWDYHTPPSNRKGRVLGSQDISDLQRRLRHVRSSETLRSRGPSLNLQRGDSILSRRTHTGSALGFRDAEVREDIELGGLGISNEGSFKQRLEQSRERSRSLKKRSMELWKEVGAGWLKVGREERGEDWI